MTMSMLTWAWTGLAIGLGWAILFLLGLSLLRSGKMTAKTVFQEALAANPDKAVALNVAVATLCAQNMPPLTVIPGLVAQCFGSSESIPVRMWSTWAAGQWANYVSLHPKWTTMTLEGFVAERQTIQIDGKDDRHTYPGGIEARVVPTVVYTAIINGKPVVFESLDDLERELFKVYQDTHPQP
jgi:hypothetical protein